VVHNNFPSKFYQIERVKFFFAYGFSRVSHTTKRLD
jgi:hypothetical protein